MLGSNPSTVYFHTMLRSLGEVLAGQFSSSTAVKLTQLATQYGDGELSSSSVPAVGL